MRGNAVFAHSVPVGGDVLARLQPDRAVGERLQRASPTAAELERIAAEEVLGDPSLQKGDIVRTERGFEF